MRYSRSSKKGFSLIEVLVSLSLLVLGAAGVWGLLASTSRANAFSQEMTDATTLAAEKLEEIISTDYDFIQSGKEVDGPYEISWAVVEEVGMSAKKIVLMVDWNNIDGVARTVEIMTYKAY